MGTTADKMQHLADTKAAIKNAIAAKGQVIGANDTFRSYSEKIAGISSECTAAPVDIVNGKTALSGGGKITGTAPVKAAETFAPSTVERTIAAGQFIGGVQTLGSIIGTAVAADVLSGKTFNSSAGIGIAGTMANNGNITQALTAQGSSYTVPAGYHLGSGKVTASFGNLTADNIKNGVNVGGVVGTLTGDATATAADIFTGKTAYVNGNKVVGVMEKGYTGMLDFSSTSSWDFRITGCTLVGNKITCAVSVYAYARNGGGVRIENQVYISLV